MAEDELATAGQALGVLYFSTDDAARAQANAWLEQFQRREQAWAVADQMIRRPELGAHVLYFAANTFHTKIMRDFHQLPPESHRSLEESILQLLQQFREGPPNVRTQLCLALANLVVQLGTWQDPISDVVRMFAGADGPSVLLLIDFLKVLPEEVTNRRNVLNRERRDRLNGYLRNCAPAFFSLMLSYCQQAANQINVIEKIFLCVHSWLRSRVVPLEAFTNSNFLTLAVEALDSEQLFDVAVDVMIEAIVLIGESRNRQLTLFIIDKLLERRQRYVAVVQSGDLDTSRGYTRLFVEASETFLPLLVSEPAHAREMLDVLLMCLTNPDLDIAQMIFTFCYHAAHLVHDKDIAPEVRAVFHPFFSSVLNAILGQLSYPLDSESWTAERRDEFSEFRHTVGDTLKDCCLVLGSEVCLQHVMQRLDAELARGSSWQTVEAILFALRSLSREVIGQMESSRTPVDELPSMQHLMNILLSNRLGDHPKIRYTITLIFGHYSAWSKLHPMFVSAQTNYILSGFADAEVAPASALALRQLAQSCGHLISGFADALLDFQHSQSDSMRFEDQLEFTEATANVVKSLPENVQQQYWMRFVAPILQGLQQLLQANPTPPLSEIKTRLTSLIDRLSICFRLSSAMQTRQSAAAPIIPQAWPIMERIFERYGPVPSVMRSLCRCSRSIVISLGTEFLPHLDSLLNNLAQGYALYKHSEYLYCALVAVRTYGHIQDLNDRFAAMATIMAGTTFVLLSSHPNDAFSTHGDIVQDFFNLMDQCTRTSPTIVLLTKPAVGDVNCVLPTVFSCAIATLSLTTTEETITASLHLIETMLYVLYDNEHEAFMAMFSPLLSARGQELVSTLFAGVMKDFSQSSVDRACKMLQLLYKIRPEETMAWTTSAIQILPPFIPQEARQDLLRSLVERREIQPIMRNMHFVSTHQ